METGWRRRTVTSASRRQRTLAYSRPATGGSTLIPAANLSPRRWVTLHRPGSFRCLRRTHGIRAALTAGLLRPISA